MGFFDKLPFGKKKDDFADDFSNPPDFSQPPGLSDPAQGDALYGADPMQNPDPFAAQPNPYGAQQQPSTFDHDVFNPSSNADTARQYAQSLGGPTSPGMQRAPMQQQGYSGAITGHEAELILERLDTIKAEIDAIKQRMMRIERFMDSADQKAGQRRYF